ncbi:unnamed protein product [Rhizophagus irregularis]|nr:unnamed protein product [Rhizophagus irregularis]
MNSVTNCLLQVNKILHVSFFCLSLGACLRKPPHTTSLEYGLAPTDFPRPQDHNYSDGYNSKIVNLIMLENNVILPDKIDVMDLSGRCHCRCAVLQIIK